MFVSLGVTFPYQPTYWTNNSLSPKMCLNIMAKEYTCFASHCFIASPPSSCPSLSALRTWCALETLFFHQLTQSEAVLVEAAGEIHRNWRKSMSLVLLCSPHCSEGKQGCWAPAVVPSETGSFLQSLSVIYITIFFAGNAPKTAFAKRVIFIKFLIAHLLRSTYCVTSSSRLGSYYTCSSIRRNSSKNVWPEK